MLGFIKNFFGGNAGNDSQLAGNVVSAAQSLDINMAIAAHENWKLRLQAFLDGSSTEQFSPEVICFDDRCDLGKWIHGEGRARLGAFPGFTALMGHHKMFHYAASNVVALSNAGKEEDARKMLREQFSKFSSEVVQGLSDLQQLVESSKKVRASRR